jgi:hypothetical protein
MQDPPKIASAEWCSGARARVEWLKMCEMQKKERLEALLRHLEDEITRVQSLLEKEKDDM